MVPYATVEEHTLENIVLLCRDHHSDKTGGRLSLERVAEGRAHPFNKSRLNSAAYRIVENRRVEIIAGTNIVKTVFPEGNGVHHALWCNGQTMLAIHSENHWLSMSMKATDERGKLLVSMDRGELRATTKAWDYRYEGTLLKIWAGPRNIIFEADISNERIHIHRGQFLDTSGDGYVVSSGVLHTIVGFRTIGSSIGCVAASNGFGGWGLLNSQKHPGIVCPGGFGFFTG